MRRTRYLILFLAIYLIFIGGTSRYVTLYQVRVLHHIVVTAVLGLWLAHRIRNKKGIPVTAFNTPLYALIGVWLISALFSLDPRMAFEHTWFPFTFVIFYFIVVDYFQRGRGKMIMEAFFFVTVLVIFLTGLEVASWYFGLGILPNTSVGWYDAGFIIPPHLPQVSMAMGISTLLAGFTVPCIFITVTWATTVRYKSHRRVLWIIAGLLFLTLILTFSRGGLLAFLGGVATFGIIRAIQHPRLTSKISPRLIGGIGGSIAIGILLVFVVVTLPLSIGRSDEGRLDMWQSAVEITLDHPITGVGSGMFGRAYRDYRDPLVGRDKLAAAHNLYLNTASELGIIGIIVGGWLAYTLLKTGWNTWQQAKGRNQHRRVEGMFVALVALGIHSTVDVFTITPINLIFILIVAYLTTGHRSITDPLPKNQIRPAYVLLLMTLVYGAFLLNWDRAQGIFQSSFDKTPDEALDLIQQSQDIDPHLNLYHLHEAFLLGQLASDGTSNQRAIDAYQRVLQLEPTWDTGWINLAWLTYQQGDLETALDTLQHARAIYPLNTASFNFAYLADRGDFFSDELITNRYIQGLHNTNHLPLADIWWTTPLSTKATQTFLDTRNIEQQYRVYRVHMPQQAESLVPTTPQSAQEWWIFGQVAIENEDYETAQDALDTAIALNPTNGDYYVSRAQVNLNDDEAVEQDLKLASLYGTRYEYPNLVRAELATTAEDVINYKATALPIRTVNQEFAAVLYTRPAVFDIPREMRLPGLGESILTPWYDVAETFVADGNQDQAIRAYQFILDNAPYEQRAVQALHDLLEIP